MAGALKGAGAIIALGLIEKLAGAIGAFNIALGKIEKLAGTLGKAAGAPKL